jgi:hypothetical protein
VTSLPYRDQANTANTMKATINRNGRLTILPENEVEAYALRCWFSNHNKGNNQSSLFADWSSAVVYSCEQQESQSNVN